MNRTEASYQFIVDNGGELTAGGPGGIFTRVGAAVGVTPQRARLILLDLAKDGRVVIEPSQDPVPGRSGVRPIRRVAVVDTAGPGGRDGVTCTPRQSPPVCVDVGAPLIVTGRDGVLAVWLGGRVAAYGSLTAQEAAETLEGLAADIRSGELRWAPRLTVAGGRDVGPCP